MASNQILKKSFVGGFRKEDVLSYIEQLQLEIRRLKEEIAKKNDEIDSLEHKAADFEKAASKKDAYLLEIEKLSTQLKAAEIEKSGILADWQTLEVERLSLVAKAETLEKEKEAADAAHTYEVETLKKDYDSKIELYREKIASIEVMISKLEEAYGKVEESEKKVAEAQVKADSIVSQAEGFLAEAKQKANEIIAEANRISEEKLKESDEIVAKSHLAAEDALACASQANDRLKTACVNYDSSASMLRASLDNLLAVLDGLTSKN